MKFAFQKMNGEPPFDNSELEKQERDLEEFEKLCAPLVDFIQKKHTPHTRIIIEWDGASLAEDIFGVPFRVPD